MRLSHSKLSTLLSCPMTYYLSYKLGITPKVEKAALSVGSAVHWGIEHNTEDLTEYFGDRLNYTRDQLLAEAMVHGYLKHKEQIFREILVDPSTGEELTLLEENHEVFIEGKLKSHTYVEPHLFVGIIDLLLLVQNSKGEKFYIVVDYKTSSAVPDWNTYLDQLYRYIFIVNSKYPDIPILKLAIINIRKTKIRQLKNENETSFLNRMKKEYDINDDSYVNWHVFSPETLDKTLVSAYLDNLSHMADTAQLIDDNNMWFINFGAAEAYGGSPYKPIFYHTPYCYVLYNIQDKIYDKDTNDLLKIRDCRQIDMDVIDYPNVLNKYHQFEEIAIDFFMTNDIDKDKLFTHISKKYRVDAELLELYWLTFLHENI